MYSTPFGVVRIVLLNIRIVSRNPGFDIHKVGDERGQIAFHDYRIPSQHKLIYDPRLIKLSNNCEKIYTEIIQEVHVKLVFKVKWGTGIQWIRNIFIATHNNWNGIKSKYLCYPPDNIPAHLNRSKNQLRQNRRQMTEFRTSWSRNCPWSHTRCLPLLRKPV